MYLPVLEGDLRERECGGGVATAIMLRCSFTYDMPSKYSYYGAEVLEENKGESIHYIRLTRIVKLKSRTGYPRE